MLRCVIPSGCREEGNFIGRAAGNVIGCNIAIIARGRKPDNSVKEVGVRSPVCSVPANPFCYMPSKLMHDY